MKNILFLSLVIMLSVGCDDEYKFTTECIPEDLQQGVIAFYPFNDGSIMDESANTHDLINTTGATSSEDRYGNSNCAFEFDNDGTMPEFLSTSKTDFLNNLDNFSISMWYQALNFDRDGGDFEILIRRGDQEQCPGRFGEWSLSLYDCRKLNYSYGTYLWQNPTIIGDCETEMAALTNKWQHLVATKSSDLYHLYINGALQESDSGNNVCANLDIGDLFIGSDYTGKVDDILIYNRALSQEEVSSLFALQTCCQ